MNLQKNKQNSNRMFFIKFFIFIIIIFLIQYFLTGPFFMRKDIKDFKMFNKLKKSLKKEREIIYFGDSTIGALGKKDIDKRSIAKILEDQIKKK